MNLEVCRKCGSLYCTIKKRRHKKLIRFCCKNNDYYLFPLFIYYKKINLSFKKQIEKFFNHMTVEEKCFKDCPYYAEHQLSEWNNKK